jgi:low temperature requirement protein LtrA
MNSGVVSKLPCEKLIVLCLGDITLEIGSIENSEILSRQTGNSILFNYFFIVFLNLKYFLKIK